MHYVHSTYFPLYYHAYIYEILFFSPENDFLTYILCIP